jgi:putative transposase
MTARRALQTIRQAKDAVHAWLLWDSRQRMHSTLNYLSPAEFESCWEKQSSPAAADAALVG